jgi:putative transposase
MKLRRPPRLAGFNYTGKHAYSLTICTYNRLRAFDDREFAREAIEKLLTTATKFGFEVIAYCVMPDHVHLVVQGLRDDSEMEAFVKSWNTQTGYYWRRRGRQKLWQEGYYDQILWSDVSLIRAARYVVMNPVRRGLVDDATVYQFSGSTRFSIAEILDDGYGPCDPKGDRQT